ncbi:hypothetical protein HO133_000036 [Letharia lupina]|uniref:PLC-like phosphodiesterase n=1 Tax=Letharia lupina TaxID=560253 RepID=A0A8H6CH97_9LECA|nr:uncharacterized protein HO133_000036 [Letharia lupina]KAF6223194.1 hypothetical protein HO133_000036 [Letharia lupina]
MRIRNTEVRLRVIFNYTILCLACTTILAIAIINFMEEITPMLVHLHTQAQVGCNGHVELCDRRYSNITQIATHDSAFVGILPTDDQDVDVTAQLDAGVRFLQAQTHRNVVGTLSLCHTSCFLKDAGSVESYLEVVKGWLDTHPKEVVTLLLTNGDNVPINDFDKVFTASGIQPYAYVPGPSHDPSILDSWPTLGELIGNGTRLVAFLDYGALDTVPYILPEFLYFWETPFDMTDPSFPQCIIDRPGGVVNDPAQSHHLMYIVNHFLDTEMLGMDIPDRRDARKTNSATSGESINAQVRLCQQQHDRAPKGILVDFFDKGDVFGVQDALNGFENAKT